MSMPAIEKSKMRAFSVMYHGSFVSTPHLPFPPPTLVQRPFHGNKLDDLHDVREKDPRGREEGVEVHACIHIEQTNPDHANSTVQKQHIKELR